MSGLTKIFAGAVKQEWVDYNGHMGDYAYSIVFSDATTAFMDDIGIDAAYRAATRCTIYTLEIRIAYLKECHVGQAFHVVQQIVDRDGKRFHVFQKMMSENGDELAWCEQLLMHMQQSDEGPRAKAFPDDVAARLEGFAAPQLSLPRPQWVGQAIGIRRK